jgi:RNA polymerase sigma-70 factor (ECF subfamily)
MVTPREDARPLAAFEEEMRRHQRMVMSVAYRLLGSIEDAQDAAQEVFFRMYRNWDRLDPDRDAGPWLYRVTVNVCRDMRRLPSTELKDCGSEDTTEARLSIEQGLERLAAKEREAVVLRDVEGLSTEEVARILGATESTVRSHIRNARKKLREICFRRRP